MITVLSMRPSTMSVVWARRRGMLRMPSLNMIAVAQGDEGDADQADASSANSTNMIRFIETPKSSFMWGS